MYHSINTRSVLAIIEHLLPYKQRLEQRATKQEWYELQQPQQRYTSAFIKPKIVFPDIAKGLRFTLDVNGFYLNNTSYFIPNDDLYLLGVLNSVIVEEFYAELSAQIRGEFLRFFRQYVEKIPIPSASDNERETISKLVQRCLDAKGIGCNEWEKEIDERVAVLYGL